MKLLSFLLLHTLYCWNSRAHGERPNSNSRIIGGEVARAGQFKFAAAIHVQTNDSRFFCTGALTGNQWIITSGICVQNAELFTIQLGSNTLNGDDPNRQILSTSNYHLHPDFNPETLENDIAVIELRLPVMLDGYIQPIFLSSVNYFNNTPGVSLGFGQISDSVPELSNDLRFVDITTLTNAECKLTYGDQITDKMVCAIGNNNEGTCIGDNGGPLIIANGRYALIIGVASFISANGCESQDPSGYTRTYPYINWINNITGR